MRAIEFMDVLKKLFISEIFHISREKYSIGDVLENIDFKCFLKLSDDMGLYIYTIIPTEDSKIEINNPCRGKMTKCIVKKIELPTLNNLAISPSSYTGQYMNEYMNYFSLKFLQSSLRENTFYIHKNEYKRLHTNYNRILKFSDESVIMYHGREKFTVDGNVELIYCPELSIGLRKCNGKLFNSFCEKNGVKLFKTLDSSLVHNKMKFEEDVLFTDDKLGIYFCDQENLKRWSFYGGKYRYLIADAIIPDDAVVRVAANRFSTNKIILKNIRNNLEENIEFQKKYNG